MTDHRTDTFKLLLAVPEEHLPTVAALCRRLTEEPETPGDAVTRLCAELEPDAVRVLEQIAGRMVMGRGQYGDLKIRQDKRDFRAEASQEALDMCVYLACEILRKT